MKLAGGKEWNGFRDRLRELVRDDTIPATQHAFAVRVGVGDALAGQWIVGRRLPSIDKVKKILAAYPTISADWLLLNEGNKYRGQARPSADLDEELRREIANQIGGRGIYQGFEWATIEARIEDSPVLSTVISLAAADADLLASWLRSKDRAAEALESLYGTDNANAIVALEEVFAADPPQTFRILRKWGA